MSDRIETLYSAEIQHGKDSNRVYLMHLGDADPTLISKALVDTALDNTYSKIFAKVPDTALQPFLDRGYQVEAWIPRNGTEQGKTYFLAYFLDPERKSAPDQEQLDKVLELCRNRKESASPRLDDGFSCEICTPDDLEEMAGLYKAVFPTYPFPIHDPDYLLTTMKSHVLYCGIRYRGTLAALSSAEMDTSSLQSEMTDFATLPQWRGKALARVLLSFMEQEVRKKGITTAYTIARAVSPGMNITFAAGGYQYTGTLVQNTQISGSIESMNVWYKGL